MMQCRSLEAAEPGGSILNSVMARCARSEPCLAEQLTRFGQVQGMSGWGGVHKFLSCIVAVERNSFTLRDGAGVS